MKPWNTDNGTMQSGERDVTLPSIKDLRNYKIRREALLREVRHRNDIPYCRFDTRSGEKTQRNIYEIS